MRTLMGLIQVFFCELLHFDVLLIKLDQVELM